MKKLFTFFLALVASVGTTFATPMTCAEALAMGNALADNTETDTIVVEGYAVNVTPYDITFGIQQFYLADDAVSTTSDLMVYRAKPTKNGAAYPVLAGDKVQLKGTIKKYVRGEGAAPIIEVMYPSVTFVTEVAGNRTLATATEITVAKALEIGAALAEGAITDDTYDIVGYVTQIDDNSFNTSYKNMVFWIADENNGAATNWAGAFEVYRGKPTQELKVGDKVSVKTKIQKYKGNIESVSSAPVTLLQAGTGETSADVVFDKNDFAGQGVSGTGGPVSAEKNGVTFTCDKGFGDGSYGVRCYKGSTVTITSATEQIAKIEFDFATVSGTSYDGGLEPVTVVNAKEWTVTLPSQARMNKISIYFGTAEAVKIDTITVAEALVIGEALADNGYSDNKYAVVGYVAKAKAFGEKYLDAQTFYMSDDATATDGDFTAYNCNVAAPGVVPGDHVTVVGKIQKFVGNSGTPTIEITGGKVVKNPFWFQYTIKGIANIEEAGTVIIDSTPIHFCHKITAVPNYGYHFVQWSDGNTENPCSFILTQDTIFTAEFAPNIYSFNVTWDEDLGNVQATDGSFEYLTPLTISATPNYGYHFVRWSDGNTDNPRTYVLKDNVTLKAIFAPKVYSISALNNPEGTVNGTGSFNYLTECSIEAVPNYGYHFVKWNDGVTDNPRTVILTQDTIFAPIYSLSKKGKCGDELALTWEYDALTKTLTISGSGTLNSNYTFGIEAPTNVERLIIAEGVTTIGGGAFANYVSIKHISVAASIKTIYEQAFYNCIGLQEIYSYRATPATAYSTTFDGIEKFDCVLHVLASSIDMYKFATGWRDFYYVEAIGVDNTTTDEIVVTPSENEANVIWPTVSGAASYELVIKDKSGNIVCTLIFNANGQLTSIAFNAPSRNGVPAQTQSAGFSFTVTGLDSGTGYDLTLTAKDNSDNAIQTETISFVTTGGNISTDMNQVQGNEVQSTKVVKDGQVLILRNGKTYTMQGQEVK